MLHRSGGGGAVLGWLLARFVRALAWTWRIEQPAWPVEGPCVVAFLHGDLLAMVGLHRDRGLIALTSRSKDGALAAAALGALGFGVIRGSSSAGGADALRAAARALREGRSPAFAVDGPRGPAGVPKPGAEALARRAGVPIVFGVVDAPGIRLRSWDRFGVPWPFARVRVRYGVLRPGEEMLEGAFRALSRAR